MMMNDDADKHAVDHQDDGPHDDDDDDDDDYDEYY